MAQKRTRPGRIDPRHRTHAAHDHERLERTFPPHFQSDLLDPELVAVEPEETDVLQVIPATARQAVILDELLHHRVERLLLTLALLLGQMVIERGLGQEVPSLNHAVEEAEQGRVLGDQDVLGGRASPAGQGAGQLLQMGTDLAFPHRHIILGQAFRHRRQLTSPDQRSDGQPVIGLFQRPELGLHPLDLFRVTDAGCQFHLGLQLCPAVLGVLGQLHELLAHRERDGDRVDSMQAQMQDVRGDVVQDHGRRAHHDVGLGPGHELVRDPAALDSQLIGMVPHQRRGHLNHCIPLAFRQTAHAGPKIPHPGTAEADGIVHHVLADHEDVFPAKGLSRILLDLPAQGCPGIPDHRILDVRVSHVDELHPPAVLLVKPDLVEGLDQILVELVGQLLFHDPAHPSSQHPAQVSVGLDTLAHVRVHGPLIAHHLTPDAKYRHQVFAGRQAVIAQGMLLGQLSCQPNPVAHSGPSGAARTRVAGLGIDPQVGVVDRLRHALAEGVAASHGRLVVATLAGIGFPPIPAVIPDPGVAQTGELIEAVIVRHDHSCPVFLDLRHIAFPAVLERHALIHGLVIQTLNLGLPHRPVIGRQLAQAIGFGLHQLSQGRPRLAVQKLVGIERGQLVDSLDQILVPRQLLDLRRILALLAIKVGNGMGIAQQMARGVHPQHHVTGQSLGLRPVAGCKLPAHGIHFFFQIKDAVLHRGRIFHQSQCLIEAQGQKIGSTKGLVGRRPFFPAEPTAEAFGQLFRDLLPVGLTEGLDGGLHPVHQTQKRDVVLGGSPQVIQQRAERVPAFHMVQHGGQGLAPGRAHLLRAKAGHRRCDVEAELQGCLLGVFGLIGQPGRCRLGAAAHIVRCHAVHLGYDVRHLGDHGESLTLALFLAQAFGQRIKTGLHGPALGVGVQRQGHDHVGHRRGQALNRVVHAVPFHLRLLRSCRLSQNRPEAFFCLSQGQESCQRVRALVLSHGLARGHHKVGPCLGPCHFLGRGLAFDAVGLEEILRPQAVHHMAVELVDLTQQGRVQGDPRVHRLVDRPEGHAFPRVQGKACRHSQIGGLLGSQLQPGHLGLEGLLVHSEHPGIGRPGGFQMGMQPVKKAVLQPRELGTGREDLIQHRLGAGTFFGLLQRRGLGQQDLSVEADVREQRVPRLGGIAQEPLKVGQTTLDHLNQRGIDLLLLANLD